MKNILIQLGIGATPYKIIKLLENKEYIILSSEKQSNNVFMIECSKFGFHLTLVYFEDNKNTFVQKFYMGDNKIHYELIKKLGECFGGKIKETVDSIDSIEDINLELFNKNIQPYQENENHDFQSELFEASNFNYLDYKDHINLLKRHDMLK